MKKIIGYILGALALISVVIGISWVSAYNGAVTKEAVVTEKHGAIHASLEGRYVKILAFVDAIEDANATVQGYLDTIMAARTAFADAIAAGNAANADESAATLDGTFITLVSYMEDNPTYNTVGLYNGFMSEISASTNAVTFAIGEFNTAVAAYNTHIKRFPNIIFLGGRTPFVNYPLANYNTTLPTFGS